MNYSHNFNQLVLLIQLKLESIGAEDIVDGNKTLILGLLWTIILRFQIQDIEIQLDDDSEKKHSSKEALLLWCQRKTHGYPHTNVVDFTQSWRSGMAFNALIHSHRPELIDYASLNPNEHINNLNHAFNVAQAHLSIQPLLDPEDVDTPKPDERSILTYISSFYHTFAKYNSEIISGKRIANIVSQLTEIDKFQANYEMLTTNLLNWIQMKIFELDNRDFPNSLEGIQNEFIKFKEYRTVEKSPKYKERCEIEALLFNIQTKRNGLGQTPYVPSEGKLVQDIQKNWDLLEKAEHKRELVLRKEMLRLEKMNNLGESFYRKSEIRKGYLNEMIQVLSDHRYGQNLSQVEATVKKHEAICVDILSRSERIEALSQMAKELEDGNYQNINSVKAIIKNILELRDRMLTLLKHHQDNLSIASNFMSSKKEIETVTNELNELIKRINIDTNVTHLRAVEEYLQMHALIEAQISSHGDTVKRLTNAANKLATNEKVNKSSLIKKEIPSLQQSAALLNHTYAKLNDIANTKREKLIKLQDFYKLLQDIDEEDATLSDKLNICQAILPGKDLLAIISLQQKHNVFEADVKAHNSRLNKITKKCNHFINNEHSEKYLIQSKLDALNQKWKQLQDLTNQKSKELADAIEAFQYHADANEAQSWLKEKMQLVKSEDYGIDEQSAVSFLQRHSYLESEVVAYEHDIERLNNQCDRMLNSGVENLLLLSQDRFVAPTKQNDDLIEVDDEVDATIIAKDVFEEVYEDVELPQLKMLYSYKGKDYSAKKGEVLLLLDKTTNDWWKVERENEKTTGYVPSNYVKEIKPKKTKVLTRKPVKVKATPVATKRASNKSAKYNRNNKRRLSIVCDAGSVEERKNKINVDYAELVAVCKTRRQLLEDSVRMFRFNRECESFEGWMNDIESDMIKANNTYNEQKQQNNIDNSVSELSKQYENFITDLLANQSRLDDIHKMAKEISAKMYVMVVKKKQDQIQKKWDNLKFLQKQLGKNIEGLTTIEVFNSACDEAVERINEKLDKINNTQDVGQDLKTVQALQRRHENIERELIPIDDSLKKIRILSDNVNSSVQKEHVAKRLDELNKLWEDLKDSSTTKRNWLDKMVGLQILKNSANDILMWITNYVKPILKYDKHNASHKNLINLDSISKEHSDLWVDIQGKKNDITDLSGLGKKLASQVPKEELAIIDDLNVEYQQISHDWHDKANYLKQCKDLIAFNQEADRIDTIINSDMAFLEFDKLGDNINDVSSLIKQHETFTNKLLAQDQRVHNLMDLGEKLIQNNHYDSSQIEERRKLVAQHRKILKDKAYERSKLLMDAKVFHEIKSDAEEFLDWCNAKSKFLDENELKNVTNMERKLKKHQAFSAEVRANKSQLDKIVKSINDVNKNSHFASKELEEIKVEVTDEWNKLIGLIESKDNLLLQALSQVDYVKSLEVVEERIDEIANIINSSEYGIDRRSCKNLIQQHKSVENELGALEVKLNDLVNKGDEIAENHFNSDVIHESYLKSRKALDDLNAPLNERKQKLDESNQFFEFEFDVNAELQWIKAHLITASSTDVPQNLTEAQNWIKQYEQNLNREVQGHESCIHKVVHVGNELIERNHSASDMIQQKINEVQNEWINLLEIMNKRHETLKKCLNIQQFLSDCVEVESWMGEKMNLLNSGIYGNDEITVVKLLQKQKTLDLEIDTYSGLIVELGRQVEKLNNVVEGDSERKILSSRWKDLNSQLKKIQKLANERSVALVELKKMHEFHRESNEFLNWIAAQKQLLLNEDYGKDYEHCSLLQSKFFDLKRTILTNEERYNQCIEFANSLAKNEDDTRFAIDSKIDYCNEAWNELIMLLNKKEQKFIAAMQIHRFNRDVADAYERIKDKSTVLNTKDLGRDTHSTQNLIRKHEIFENDLVALEAQLQVLINDCDKLTKAYPGNNAKNILEKTNSVVEHWDKLKESSTIRRQHLCDAYEYFRFVSVVRDLEQWALDLVAEMKTQENVRDVQSTQMIKNNHERIKSEIDSREEEFNIVVQEANNLTSNSFYPEIKTSTERLLSIRDDLHNSWEMKNVYLDQLYDLNFFLRDVKQLEQLCHQHLNKLNSYEFGDTVQEVSQTLKKHQEFMKIFNSLEYRFVSIQECGNKLIQKEHFESETIQTRLNEALGKRKKLSGMVLERLDELSDALILVQFKRDLVETELWIDEKHSQIEKEQHSIQDDDNIEFKLQKLQKLQTFEAEINANASRIEDIQSKANHLIKKKHPSSIEIRSQQDNLLRKWADLVRLLREISQGFEEAKDIYEFNKNIGEVESWIREKELMIQFNETGEDFEHCTSLLRKLDDVDTDMKVDENRISQINELANKLTSQCKREFFNEEQLNQQRVLLNDNWQQLQQKISDYRNRLICVKEIHSLNRDLDDINQRIMEKQVLVNKDCEGKSLPSVEMLQRKHEAIMLDICAIEGQFRTVNDNDCRRLFTKYPDLTEKSRDKVQTIQSNLRKLNKDCKSKENKLSFHITLHKFFDAVKEMENWAQELLANKLKSDSNAVNVAEAKNDLQAHEFVKAEINARREDHHTLKNYGITLLQNIKQDDTNSGDCAQNVENCIEKIDELRKKLDQAWEDKQIYLKHCLELRIFHDLSKHCDSWLSAKEAFLNNEDIGSNLASVEDLLKKHHSFIKSLEVQQRVTEFVDFAEKLIEKKHFQSETIQTKLSETLERRNHLQELCQDRLHKLVCSKQYFQFLRNFNEIQRWLNEKIKVATDESYRELINLLSKVQRHAAFEAEITANKDRVEAVVREGEELINSNHFNSKEIKLHLSSIEKLRRTLNESANLKRARLNDSFQALQFFRLCDDIELWVKDVESMFNDMDRGNDLTSVRNILKKHQLIENDVHNHNENIEQVKDHLMNFIHNNHFLKEEIEERAKQTIKCFDSIQEPMNKQREIIEERLTFYEFKRDIEDELYWLKEKENHMTQFDNVATLNDIHRLLKKLKIFESELQTREPQFSALVAKGHNLIKSNNNNSEDIKQLTYDIQSKIQHLKDESALRKFRLAESLESFQFYADVDEAESWLNEKKSFLLSDDIGNDEESVVSLIKKLDVIRNDMNQFFGTTLNKLIQQSNLLIEKNHFDGLKIKERKDNLLQYFNTFDVSINNKRTVLQDRIKYFQFERDADELILWIKDQLIVANSEDYGQDVEHVEMLIQQFDNFVFNVNANEERIDAIQVEAKNVENSEEKLSKLMTLWNQLKDSILARQTALQGAKKMHTFDKSVDETICWIREKISSTVLDRDNINYDDLFAIQAKIRELEGFDRDLGALREQVEALYAEADKLIVMFPDIQDTTEERKNRVHVVWERLNKETLLHKEDLHQIEKIQSYFDEYQELKGWINKMFALITAEDKLGSDVVLAEEQLNRHKEYKLEIDSRNENVSAFLKNGENIIEKGHIMSNEIKDRNNTIMNLHKNLIDTWNERLTLYQYNLDARQFIQDSEQVEKWINTHYPFIDDNNFGDSLAEVEELISKHEEFEKTISAQADKLKSIERVTMIEEYFKKLKQKEEEAKMLENSQLDKIRLENRIKEEQRKILHERSNEESNYYENAPFMEKNKDVRSSTPTSQRKLPLRISFSRKNPKIKPAKANLPPVSCEGFLERKQILQKDGKKATSRSWKTHYTLLCGQLLCFFKDKKAFYDNVASSPPFSILDARCVIALEYTKKKHVFSIQLTDMTKYLFAANDNAKLQEWVKAIVYRAMLPPAFQLLQEGNKDVSKELPMLISTDPIKEEDGSSSSSHKSLTSLPNQTYHPQVSQPYYQQIPQSTSMYQEHQYDNLPPKSATYMTENTYENGSNLSESTTSINTMPQDLSHYSCE